MYMRSATFRRIVNLIYAAGMQLENQLYYIQEANQFLVVTINGCKEDTHQASLRLLAITQSTNY